MAYVTRYQFRFTNELQELIQVFLMEKDGEGDIQEYEAINVKLTYDGDEGKDACLFGLSLDVEFDIRPDQVDYWNDLVNAQSTQWRVVAYNDSFKVFEGFILPDEGAVPFQDRPYNAKISAVDGIGILRDTPFIQPNHTNFTGINKLIWYIASALQQTGQILPIRVYDNVYHSSMNNRDDDFKWDFFSQAYLEYRTFLKDATAFVSAYDALKIILGENYRLFYWNGQWVIIRIALLQYWPFAKYYTQYDYNGLNAEGFEELDNYATVGRSEMIYPINEDQIKYTKKAIKSAKTTFEYEIWPEIPKNNKFERGNLIIAYSGPAYDDDDIDDDDNTAELIGTKTAYEVEDWTYGTVPLAPGGFPIFPFNLTPVTQRAYVKKVTNSFGVELYRHIVTEMTPGTQNWLKSEGVPIVEGDKVSFGIDIAFATNWASGSSEKFTRAARIYIIGNNNYYGLSSEGNWKKNNLGGIDVLYSVGDDTTQWHSVSVKSNSAPISGTLYIVFDVDGDGDASIHQKYKSFSFEVHPFISGGYVEVKGEYHFRSQNKNFPDVSEKIIKISDTDHKVFKGCLLDSNGDPFTRDWYRMGLTESKHFNDLTNLAWYNHSYRRFLFIEGTFDGLKCAPSNNQENQYPTALHKQYRFVDIAGEDRRFIITAPFELDYGKGWTTTRFHEVLLAGSVIETQKESIQNLVGRIRSAIDNTTAEQWDSAGQAPASGTAGFPPVTYQLDILTPQPWKFQVYMNIGDDMTASVTGDALISRVVNPDYLGYRVIEFSINMSSYSVGDIITFTAYGHSVSVTVQEVEVSVSPDGEQTGDFSEFKYRFG